MVKSTKVAKKQPTLWPLWVFVGLSALLSVVLFIPINYALSSGVASLSLLIFPLIALMTLLIILFYGVPHTILRICLSAGLLLSVASSIYPQAGYYGVAQSVGASLSWNPVRYAKFSGATTISPDKTLIYKQTGNKQLSLALYGQAQNNPKPVVLLLHGGGWRYGNYLETGRWPEVLTQAGFLVASAQYRLSSPTHPTWQESPADVHDALVYLHEHASTLGIDRQRITLMGQSAGGHLALLEAYKNDGVYSVISLYAPIDLAYDYTSSRDKSSELNFIGGGPDQFSERYGELSPSSYVKQTSPMTLVVQGTRDDLVATANATLLAQRLSDFGVKHQIVLLPFTGHSFENQQGGFATQIAEQVVLGFLKR